MARSDKKSIFISVANAEHAALRAALRDVLSRLGFHVVVQPDFPHTTTDTVRKLESLVRPCDLLLHIVGNQLGSVASPVAVADFFTFIDRESFLAHLAQAKAKLGDFQSLTYSQWEPWFALHHKGDVLVYGVDGHKKLDFPQRTQLDALAAARCHAETLMDEARRCGQIVADVCHHFGIVHVEKERKIAPSRILKHAPDKLFGREKWLEALDEAWRESDNVNVYTLVAWGGVGKTALVAHWVASRFHTQHWPGVERYFDWSFYSQGTGESRQTSSDLFIQEALKFFDDPDPLKGSPWERGERLAGLIRKHRTLLVLDGIEPLQYPPTDPQAGRLKDQALEALIQSLAADNPGLCLITTREHLTNVESLPAAKENKLDKLHEQAAVALLRHLQLVGTDEEMIKAWDAAGGHALTLRLLGRLIARAYGKDVRKWREVKFVQADKLAQGRSAMKVMRKYEEWLRSADSAQQLELAVLRLTGLFDRPMSPDCFRALCAAPAIRGLTETLVAADAAELEAALDTLVSNDLLTHGGIEAAAPVRHSDLPIDAHPLIREYFAKQMRETQPEAIRAAHSRLFDHLCTTTPHRPDTLDGLQPLYQAVVHGCLAGRQQEACNNVYVDRILRGVDRDGFFSAKKLGAIGTEIAAIAAFFEEPWCRVSSNLREADKSWLLHQAAYHLHDLGRLAESLDPMRRSLELPARLISEAPKRQEPPNIAANIASNLSELELTLGELTNAVADAQIALKLAVRSRDWFLKLFCRTTLADALHQAGQRKEAGTLFKKAENTEKAHQPKADILYSLQGFRYCDWLLAPAEFAAWHHLLRGLKGLPGAMRRGEESIRRTCAEVKRRATRTLKWAKQFDDRLGVAHDNLTLCRVELIRTILKHRISQPSLNLPPIADAVNGLRKLGTINRLPKALLTAALYHFVRGESDLARARLNETQQIAERGPMRPYLADVHLHRARMFRDKAELAKAAKLIRELGYGRRYDELADAEEAAKNWSANE